MESSSFGICDKYSIFHTPRKKMLAMKGNMKDPYGDEKIACVLTVLMSISRLGYPAIVLGNGYINQIFLLITRYESTILSK